jgi:hypothetical protein
VHLYVVEVLALAEVVVVGGGEEPRAVPPHDGLQEAVVDVERQHLPGVHRGRLVAGAEPQLGGGRRRWRGLAGARRTVAGSGRRR